MNIFLKFIVYVSIGVAEPKLFIFGSGFTFVHNFGSSYSHLKLFFNSSTILIEVEISFASSSKLSAENIYLKKNSAPAPQNWFKTLHNINLLHLNLEGFCSTFPDQLKAG